MPTYKVLVACPNEEQKDAFKKVKTIFNGKVTSEDDETAKFELKITDNDAFLE